MTQYLKNNIVSFGKPFAAGVMAQPNVEKAIHKYENFINNVLREDLKNLHIALEKVNAELADLIQQKHALKVITDKNIHPNGFKTQLNIGCNFFMEAAVPDASKMLMNVGLNYYVEFSLDEANNYLDFRIKGLEKKTEEIQQKAAEAKAHIKLILFSINKLQTDMSRKES